MMIGSIQKGFLAILAVWTMSSCLSNVELADEVKAKENQSQILAYFAKQNQSPIAIENGGYYALTKTNAGGELASKGDTLRMQYELSNLATGQVIESPKDPLVYQFGYLNPIFGRLMSYLKDGEEAVLALPGTSQSFDGLPAFTPLKVVVKNYSVRSQNDRIDEFIAAKKYTVKEKTPEGLRYISLSPGTGDIPTSGKVVKLKYTGRFLNGIAFDGNMARTDSFSVTIGNAQTVAGFSAGVSKMRLGEKAILVFPSSLGYGAKGSSTTIPGFTPLVFEIYVAKIQ
jgi:FKBP-type peptidyl-prolyl cis-trans isomerase